MSAFRRLHIGGEVARRGWELLNIEPGPGVDHVADVRDLSRLPAGAFATIYASHVLEHVSHVELLACLQGLHRLLRPGGWLLVSVPNLRTLCELFLRRDLDDQQRWHVMRMIYGGQLDPNDQHRVGLTPKFLSDFLLTAGFARVDVEQEGSSFGLFRDTSEFAAYGVPISVNMRAQRATRGRARRADPPT